MADIIATLGYAVDTSGLEKGNVALEQATEKNNALAASAAQASEAVKAQGSTTQASSAQMQAAYGSTVGSIQAQGAALGTNTTQMQAASAATVELTASQKAMIDSMQTQIGVQQLIADGYAKNSTAVAQFTALRKAGTAAETEAGKEIAANAGILAALTNANQAAGAATKAASAEVEGFTLTGGELRHGMEAVTVSAEDLGVKLSALGGLAGVARGGFVLLAGAVGAGLAASLATAGDAMITAKSRLEGIAGVSLSNKLLPQLDDIAKNIGAQPAAIAPAVEAFVKLGQTVNATSSIQFKAPVGMEAFLPGIQGATQLQAVITNLGLFMRGSGVDDTAKMTSAITQFGNAMNKTGTLTAQDFAALNDAAPKLGRAIAEAFMGTSLNAPALFEKSLQTMPMSAQRVTAAIAAMGPAAQKSFHDVEESAKTTAGTIDSLKNSAESWWQAIAGQSGAPGAAQKAIEGIKQSVDDSTASVKNGTSAFNVFFNLLANQPTGTFFDDIQKWLNAINTGFEDAGKSVHEFFVGLYGPAAESFNALTGMFDKWLAGMEGDLDKAPWNWQGLTSSFQSALSGMQSAFNSFISGVVQAIQNAGAGAASSANASGGPDAGIYAGSFASGGSFTVGGSGGTDSQLISFHATPGESVTVNPPGTTGSLIGDTARAISANAVPSIADNTEMVSNTLSLGSMPANMVESQIKAPQQVAVHGVASAPDNFAGTLSGAIGLSADQITKSITELTAIIQKGQVQAKASAIPTSLPSASKVPTAITEPTTTVPELTLPSTTMPLLLDQYKAAQAATASANKQGMAANSIGNFATGGSFVVGGSGGTDSQLVNFKATPGESVTVNPPGSSGSLINDTSRAVSSNAVPGVTDTGITTDSNINASQQFANQVAASSTPPENITGPIAGAVGLSADQITQAISQLTNLVQQGQAQQAASSAPATVPATPLNVPTDASAPTAVPAPAVATSPAPGLVPTSTNPAGTNAAQSAYQANINAIRAGQGKQGSGVAFVNGQVVPSTGPSISSGSSSGSGGGGSSSGGGGSSRGGGGGGGDPFAPTLDQTLTAVLQTLNGFGMLGGQSGHNPARGGGGGGVGGGRGGGASAAGTGPIFNAVPSQGGAGISGLAGYRQANPNAQPGSAGTGGSFGDFVGPLLDMLGMGPTLEQAGRLASPNDLFAGLLDAFGPPNLPNLPGNFTFGDYTYPAPEFFTPNAAPIFAPDIFGSGGDLSAYAPQDPVSSGYGDFGASDFGAGYSNADPQAYDYSGGNSGDAFDFGYFAGGGSFKAPSSSSSMDRGSDTIHGMIHLSPGEQVSVGDQGAGGDSSSNGGGRNVNGGMGRAPVINIYAQNMAGVEQSRASLMRTARNMGG